MVILILQQRKGVRLTEYLAWSSRGWPRKRQYTKRIQHSFQFDFKQYRVTKVCFTQITSTMQRNSKHGNKVLFNPWRFILFAGRKTKDCRIRNRFSVSRAPEIKVGTKQVPSLHGVSRVNSVFADFRNSTQLLVFVQKDRQLVKNEYNVERTQRFLILALCVDSHLVLVRCCSVVMRKCDSL